MKVVSMRPKVLSLARPSSASWPGDGVSSGVLTLSSKSLEKKVPASGPRSSTPVSWSVLLPTLAGLGLLILLVLGQKAQLVKAQYAYVNARSQQLGLLKEQAELKLRMQRLSSLDRIDALARKKLHMVAPTERLVLDLGVPSVARQSSGTVGYNATTAGSNGGFSEGTY